MKKGFTLIEMLVVIVTIAVLMSVGLFSYASIGKSARDTKRKDDLNTLQKEFEMYYQAVGSYPAPAVMSAANCFASLKLTITTAIKPVDPDTGLDYTWDTCTAQSYCLCTGLLEVQNGNASGTSCTFVTSGTNYCVRNVQTLDLP